MLGKGPKMKESGRLLRYSGTRDLIGKKTCFIEITRIREVILDFLTKSNGGTT